MSQVIVANEKLPAASSEITPMQMLSMAVQQGGNLETMEKLMDMQERWEANEAKKAYVSAMTKFKSEPLDVKKNTHVSYAAKGMITQYSHANLADVVRAVVKNLSKYGLSHSWSTSQDGNGIKVSCVITHELGHSESVSLIAPPDSTGGKNFIQSIGSTVTYLQRYTLMSITGLAADGQDDDGLASGGDQPVMQEPQPQQSAKPTITPEQQQQLINAANVSGVDLSHICRKGGVNHISELAQDQFEPALGYLKRVSMKGGQNE